MSHMNAFQNTAARAFKNGKYAHLIDVADWPSRLPQLGDTLFAFVMLELSNAEGCNSDSEAAYRMTAAARELQAVADDINSSAMH